MAQIHSSAKTSVNKNKIPSPFQMLDWSELAGCGGLYVLDYGCGRYNSAKEYIDQIGGDYYGYDPYWGSSKSNAEALKLLSDGLCSCAICANVLNVIDDDAEVQRICNLLEQSKTWDDSALPFFVTVYYDLKKEAGESKNDCYQRHWKPEKYIKFFKNHVEVRKGVITNRPDLIL